MNTPSYDFLVYIGRFQPFHNGHLSVIQAGMQHAQKMIVFCGSAHQPRNTRNPWTAEERERMIRGALTDSQNARLYVSPLMDVMYNDGAWVRNIQSMVQGIVTAHYRQPHRPAKIGLIGSSKDHSSYYLNLFPQWGSVRVPNYNNASATRIRETYFDVNEKLIEDGAMSLNNKDSEENLPTNVRHLLTLFAKSDDFSFIRDEHNFITRYKSAWKDAPYEPVFVTVDAVVVQSGHILLVQRKARPGKGLMALPGGFLNSEERLLDSCIRELKEETRLKVPAPVLKGSIKGQQVFDDPHRSARGRTVTHAFHIALEPSNVLPKVKGGDDAKHARWVELAQLDPAHLYEDHYFIIQEMLGM